MILVFDVDNFGDDSTRINVQGIDVFDVVVDGNGALVSRTNGFSSLIKEVNMEDIVLVELRLVVGNQGQLQLVIGKVGLAELMDGKGIGPGLKEFSNHQRYTGRGIDCGLMIR